MNLDALYPPPPRRNRWILAFLVGLVALLAALAWWLRWEPPQKETPQELLPLVKRSPASTNAGAATTAGTRSAGGPAAGTNRTLQLPPGWPPGVTTSNAPAPSPFVPNANLAPRRASPEEWTPRPPQTVLEAQIALARLGFSPGSIDGRSGPRTRNALRAFQQRNGLRPSASLDVATRGRLLLQEPPYTRYTVTAEDLARLLPVGSGWLAKSLQPRLDYESLEELIGEQWQTDPEFIKQLNQDTGWINLTAGTRLLVPNVRPPEVAAGAAFVRIRLADRTLQAFDEATNLVAHFPCSIGRSAANRPLGELRVVVIIRDPEYLFDPARFPASPEARTLGAKLRIPPGPNNPVGSVWIGLDRSGYGIHGTPRPEQVGIPESLGCFRLANWNAELLARLAWPGMPVHVVP